MTKNDGGDSRPCHFCAADTSIRLEKDVPTRPGNAFLYICQNCGDEVVAAIAPPEE